jgi:hypothetical protein
MGLKVLENAIDESRSCTKKDPRRFRAPKVTRSAQPKGNALVVLEPVKILLMA